MIRLSRFFSIATLGLATALSAPAPAEQVDLELALLIDVSSSVSLTDFNLQMTGYVDAFRDPGVQAAVLSQDGVAVQVMQWSSDDRQATLPWRLLETAEDCEAFATEIERMPRHFNGGTVMSAAIELAFNNLANNAYESPRQVIDVSGDGVCTNERRFPDGSVPRIIPRSGGTPWPLVMAERPETTTINGIAIDAVVDGSVAEWYAQTLVRGPEHFAMSVESFEAFGEGIKRKLIREIGEPEELLPLASYD